MDAGVRYLTRFRTTDPVVYIQRAGERGMIVVPQMEHERAVRESIAAVATRAVVEFFRDRGYESDMRGFTHSLGHGVGLEVHEEPSLGSQGGPLSAGNIVTLEPGLYYPGTGGVRLEDMGAVTETGFDRFTQYEEELTL